MTWNDAIVITILLFLSLLFIGCSILARHDKLTHEERERIREYYRGGKLPVTGWNSRTYRVVKVNHHTGRRWWVVSEDITNPDVWVVINEFDTVTEAYEYVKTVTARNRELA